MSSTRSKLSIEDIRNISSNLQSMPEVETSPTKSKAEAVQMLKGDIEQLRERGYSFEQIAEALATNGLELSVPTLKNYLYRAKQKPSKQRQKKASEKQKDDLRDGKTKPHKVNMKKASFELEPDTEDI